MAEAVEPEAFRQYDKGRTINWLFSEELITQTQKSAIKDNNCNPVFSGVSDLLPFLEDDGVINLQAVLDEVAGTKLFSLRSVARIKQEMRKAAGIADPTALATESVQVDTTEAQEKLQRVGEALAEGGDSDKLAEIVSKEMSFHSDDSNKKKGVDFIRNLYSALEGDGDEEQNVRNARQLKLVGPSNNGKTCLAQWMARMWVASATDNGKKGRWIETFVTMETMDAHLWSARESTGSAPREIWGPLRYLFALASEHKSSRFALVLHESNRGGLFNALNRIWWEKRRNYPSKEGIPESERIPPNLALIFTENPKTADYATIGDGDEALLTRLTPKSTFALVRGGTDEDELKELGVPEEERRFSTENVGLFYAAGLASEQGETRLEDILLRLAGGEGDVRDDAEFKGQYHEDVAEFRKQVAGKQIDIIRNRVQPGRGSAPRPATPAPAPADRSVADSSKKNPFNEKFAEVRNFLHAQRRAGVIVTLKFLTDVDEKHYPKNENWQGFYEAIKDASTLEGAIEKGLALNNTKYHNENKIIEFLAQRISNRRKICVFVVEGGRDKIWWLDDEDDAGHTSPVPMDTNSDGSGKRSEQDSDGHARNVVQRTDHINSPRGAARQESAGSHDSDFGREQLERQQARQNALEEAMRKHEALRRRSWTVTPEDVGKFLAVKPYFDTSFYYPALIIAKTADCDTYLIKYIIDRRTHRSLPTEFNPYEEIKTAMTVQLFEFEADAKTECQDFNRS